MNTPQQASPFFPYSFFYFISVSFYAFILAFFPLYCKNLGFTPFGIALISGAGMLARISGPPMILQCAHTLVPSRKLLIFCTIAAFSVFLLLLQTKVFSLLILIWAVCVFMKRGGDSLVDAQVLRDSAEQRIRFEQVRLWGSVGFIIATLIMGTLVDELGPEVIPISGASNLFLIIIAAIIVFPTLPATTGKTRKDDAKNHGFVQGEKYWQTFALIVGTCALLAASHSIVYAYLSIYLEAIGWSGKSISIAWNIGVVAEISFFFLFYKFEARISLVRIFQLSIVCTILRWLVLFSTQSTIAILCAQILHAFSFGGIYLTSLKLVHKIMPDHLKDRGQGLLISLGSGVGSLVGFLITGMAASHIESYAEIQHLFLGSALIALVALFVSMQIALSDE